MLTGSYSNYFHIYDRESKAETVLQADKAAFKSKRAGAGKVNKLGGIGSRGATKSATATNGAATPGKKDEINADTIDYAKKILHSSWHPQEYSVAVAATNNLFLFSVL